MISFLEAEIKQRYGDEVASVISILPSEIRNSEANSTENKYSAEQNRLNRLLSIAISNNDIDKVRRLLESGTNPNFKISGLEPALYWPFKNNNLMLLNCC